jgi:hypothetical protein
MVVLHLLNELIRGVRGSHLGLRELGSLLDWLLLDVLRSIISSNLVKWRGVPKLDALDVDRMLLYMLFS